MLAYARTVWLPAHLEFVFEDQIAVNISIKVPCATLNLNLESPIVQSPVHFPCVSTNPPLASGPWAVPLRKRPFQASTLTDSNTTGRA